MLRVENSSQEAREPKKQAGKEVMLSIILTSLRNKVILSSQEFAAACKLLVSATL